MFSSIFKRKKYLPISCEEFHQMVAQNNISVVKYHLDNNFNSDCEINSGVTPLMTAAVFNRTEIIGLLIKYKSNINKQSESGWSTLLYAAKNGNFETVKLLVDHKVNINLQLKGGENAFIEACFANHEKIALLLLENGVDINTDNNEIGLNALIVASNMGNLKILEKTLAKTENINHQNKYGETALMRAAIQGHLEIVNYLLKKWSIKRNKRYI